MLTNLTLAFINDITDDHFMSEVKPCPFCSLPEERLWLSDESGLAFLDNYPIAAGHTLVVPRIHVGSIFDLTAVELAGLWELVARARAELKSKYQPDGFNIGVNDGSAAGQTVSHAHIHVIPRFKGDVVDPRGGVRWIIADKAKYW